MEVSGKSINMEQRKSTKCASFEVSIGTVAPHFDHLITRIPVIEGLVS